MFNYSGFGRDPNYTNITLVIDDNNTKEQFNDILNRYHNKDFEKPLWIRLIYVDKIEISISSQFSISNDYKVNSYMELMYILLNWRLNVSSKFRDLRKLSI